MAAPKTSLNPKARPRTKTKEKTLRGRPVWIDNTGEVTGEKGSKYSEVTTTIPWGTEWITAPSIDENGKRLSDDEVKQRLLKTGGKDFITGEKLPTFSNPEKASEYAQWRSDTMFDQEAIEQGFPEEFPMGPEPERKDFIDRSIDKGKDFLEYLTTPSKHGVFNEGGDVGLPTNRLIYDVDDITGRGPEGKIKRDAAKKRVLEKYNLEGARSGWKVSPSKLVSILGNLPTNVRLLTEFMLGKDKPININDFTKDELASIIALSEEQQENYKNVQNRKLKNQPENVTTVDGYDTTQPYRFSKWIENSPYFRTLAFTLTDPNYQTRTTLGRYDTEETPSSIIIKDAYDMNIKQRDLPNPFGDRKELSKVLEEVRSNPEVAGEFLANIIRPNQTDSRKFDLVIPKRKPDQPSPRDTAHQAPMQLKEKPKDNPRIKEEIPEGFDILNFNKGGIAMNEQMEMAFMQQGGLKDDGMKQDPVSGNEVPNGSMAKEVRDDIPAQLSEGEYVVPADVVRFYGVKHFEDLRNKAKGGLNQMEKDGRIGGEPVPDGGPTQLPFKDQDLQVKQPQPQQATPAKPQMAGASMNTIKPRIGMSKGGYIGTSMEAIRMRNGGEVKGFASGGLAMSEETPRGASEAFSGSPNLFRGYGGARSGGGLEVRTYVNATGAILLIPFLGGRPLVTIPEGFFLQGSPEATEAAQGEQQVTQNADGTVGDDDDDDGGPDTPEVTVQKVTAPEDLDQSDSFFGVNQDFFGMTPEELGNYGEDFGETAEMLRYGGIAALAVPALAPVAMIAGAASQVTKANDVANLRAAAQIAEMRGYTDQAKTLNSRANQMVKDGGFLLKAMDKVGGINGDNIADKVMTSYTTIFDYGEKGDAEGLKIDMFATTDDFVNVLKANARKGYKWVDEGVVVVDPITGEKDVKGYYAIDENAEEVEIPTADGGTVSVSVASLPTTDDKDPRGVTFAGTTDSGVNVFEVTAGSNIVRPKARPTDIGSDSTTTTTTTTTAGSKDTNIASSGRSESDIQKDINDALSASGGEWTSELNDLVSERDSARSNEGGGSSGGGWADSPWNPKNW